MRTVLFLALFSTVAFPAVAQKADLTVFDQFNYSLYSSKGYGLNPDQNTKYNYVVDADCKLTEPQAKVFSRKLADSLASARPNLEEITVFLYLKGMNPKSVAYSDAEYTRGSLTDQNFREYATLYTKWENADYCE